MTIAAHTERHPSEAVENYAKAIYALEERGDSAVTTNALAERLDVTPASASAMVKKMSDLGLTTHQLYRGVTLTDPGRKLALEVLRHHRLLELYLSEALGMPWDHVHAEAEKLEHVLSEELEDLIAAKLGDPTVDPHGDPIPTREGTVDETETASLADLAIGDRGRFMRVSDSDPDMLRYLAERHIAPGQTLEVREKQPFDGPLWVAFEGHEEPAALGGRLARAMRVVLT